MNLRNILIVITFLLIPFQSSVFSIPLVFGLLIFTYLLYPEETVIFSSIIAGIILDVTRFSPLGISAIFLVLTFLLVEVLKKEVLFNEFKFILGFVFITTFIYAKLFSYSQNLLWYFLLLVVSVSIFSLIGNNKPWLVDGRN